MSCRNGAARDIVWAMRIEHQALLTRIRNNNSMAYGLRARLRSFGWRHMPRSRSMIMNQTEFTVAEWQYPQNWSARGIYFHGG